MSMPHAWTPVCRIVPSSLLSRSGSGCGVNGWDDDRERLERRMRFNALYDLYSPLLTERQRDVYEMLHFSDLAPAEVAKSLGITRQAVHILVRRTMDRLDAIERDLKFAEIVERLEGRIRELEESLRRYTDV